MSEHTKEPWHVGRNGSIVADEPIPEMGGSDAVEYYGGHLICESVVARNARRIVACVNACAGLSTVELELISIMSERLQAKCVSDGYKQQCDGLLAEVERLIASWNHRALHALPADAMLINKHVRELQDAIAKIQGGAT